MRHEETLVIKVLVNMEFASPSKIQTAKLMLTAHWDYIAQLINNVSLLRHLEGLVHFLEVLPLLHLNVGIEPIALTLNVFCHTQFQLDLIQKFQIIIPKHLQICCANQDMQMRQVLLHIDVLMDL